MLVGGLDVAREPVGQGHVREALLLRGHEREAEGQHHNLGYLRPCYLVVRAERAVFIAGDDAMRERSLDVAEEGTAWRHVGEVTTCRTLQVPGHGPYHDLA